MVSSLASSGLTCQWKLPQGLVAWSGLYTRGIFWKNSMAVPPGPLSDADLAAFDASVKEISHWAQRRIQPLLDILQERFRAIYGERLRGVYVFGSYARPDAGIELPESSDLDVALILSDFENLYERTYCVMFEAASAMLAAADMERDSHYGVKIKFGELSVKTGRVDPKFGRYVSRSLDLREDADYALDSPAEVPREVAEEQFRKAFEFLEMAESFLKAAGGEHEAGQNT
jgi:uncharacterized protein (UPF0332 family)